MPIRIGNNISAINAGRHLGRNSADFATRIERLSSGLRINRGADDAAGLAVSEGMRAEISGMKQAVNNAEAGMGMIQLAEGALSEVSAMIRRMRELAVQSANSTINDSNRGSLAAEFNHLTAEIDRIANSTTYNGNVLLTGFGNTVSQDADVSTALDGFTGAQDVQISGAVAGTYRFIDDDDQDNQITLERVADDGTVLSQSIDVGTSLDVDDDGQFLVATGSNFVANFDRLGIQVTLVGAGADTISTTLKSLSGDSGAGGDFIVGEEVVTIAAGEDLEDVAIALDAVLSGLGGSATYDATHDEVQIETAGNVFTDVDDILELTSGNSYIDGRLDGREIVITESVGGNFQVGPGADASNQIGMNILDMRASGNELNLTGLSVAKQDSSRDAITILDQAILKVARQRGDLGAVQNRLQFTTANLGNAIENLTAAESSIRDADMAEEIAEFTKSQILTQAATAMVTQANALPETALRLLQ